MYYSDYDIFPIIIDEDIFGLSSFINVPFLMESTNLLLYGKLLYGENLPIDIPVTKIKKDLYYYICHYIHHETDILGCESSLFFLMSTMLLLKDDVIKIIWSRFELEKLFSDRGYNINSIDDNNKLIKELKNDAYKYSVN